MVGHRRTCHHLPSFLGKGCSPSALSCLALLHETAQSFQPGHQKAKRETVGSCFVLIQHPARHLSQASPMLTQSCPIPPLPRAAGMCMGRAQPTQNQPQGISMALKHARNFTQAFRFLFLPRALPQCPGAGLCPGAGFVRQVKAQLLELLTHRWGVSQPPSMKITFSQLQNHK